MLVDADIGVLDKAGRGVIFRLCQGVIRREHRQQPVTPQKGGLQGVPRRKSQKAAVHLSPANQLLHLGELPLADQVEPDARVERQKFFHNARKPVNGDAGKGADPQSAAGEAVEGGDLGLQGPLGVAQGLDVRQQGLPLGGEDHAVLVPGQQGHVPFPLQVGDGAAHRRLRIPHVLRRPGDAPQLHSFQENLTLDRVHLIIPFAHIIYENYSLV